jgi:hypothetical protein
MTCLLLALLFHFTIHRKVTRSDVRRCGQAGRACLCCCGLQLWGRTNDRVRLSGFRASMTIVLEWVESTDLSTAIREGLFLSILSGFHLTRFAHAACCCTDLRLLGWAMQRRPVSDIVQRSAVEESGCMMVASGLLLAWAEPQKLYRSPRSGSNRPFCSRGCARLVFREGF